MASQQLFAGVPLYAGLTLDEIGGQGVRWWEREATASAWPQLVEAPKAPTVPNAGPEANGRLRIGTYRSVWAGPEVAASPALHFLRARQVVELSPADAQALGIRDGDRAEVGSNGHRVQGPVRLRASVPVGSVFVAAGTHEQAANLLTEPLVEVRRVAGGDGAVPTAIAAQVQPAVEGLAEPPASAPLDIPPTAGGGGAIGGGSQG
jgi:NADH-quinone oxidoreductase subunit G